LHILLIIFPAAAIQKVAVINNINRKLLRVRFAPKGIKKQYLIIPCIKIKSNKF